MKVKDLVRQLSKMDQSLEVFLAVYIDDNFDYPHYYEADLAIEIKSEIGQQSHVQIKAL